MTILEHVVAGHYPTDTKGRPLVPMVGGGGGRPITITATDGPEGYPLVGFGIGSADMWTADGVPFHNKYPGDQLAPPKGHP